MGNQIYGFASIAIGLFIVLLTIPSTASIIGIALDPELLIVGIAFILGGFAEIGASKGKIL